MHAEKGDRVALLMLRVWIERDANRAPLRIRVTCVEDVAAPRATPQTTVMADVDQACEFVRAWLAACESVGNPPT